MNIRFLFCSVGVCLRRAGQQDWIKIENVNGRLASDLFKNRELGKLLKVA
jgi:hypothetical protein